MDVINFNEIVTTQVQECLGVLIEKAKEYATEDRLHNFRVAANLQDTTLIAALVGFMAKHTVSIYDMSRAPNDFYFDQWEEKITDHINYLLLLRVALSDAQVPVRPPRPAGSDY